MQKILQGQSVIFLAKNFNPSILSSHWLIKNNIVKEEDIIKGASFFTPNVINLTTEKFELIVDNERLQLSTKGDEAVFEDIIVNVLMKLVTLLPETPYRAMGINFLWEGLGDKEELLEIDRTLINDKLPAKSLFQGNDEVFGISMSKQFLGSELNFDIKPYNFYKNSKDFRLRFIFNYHIDIDGVENKADKVLEALKNMMQFKTESKKIVDSI